MSRASKSNWAQPRLWEWWTFTQKFGCHSFLSIEQHFTSCATVTHPCTLFSPYPSSLRREQYLGGFKGVTKWISSSPWMGVRGVRHSLKLDMPAETGLCGSAVVDTVCLRASSSACHSPWCFAQANNYFSNHSSPASDQRDPHSETQYSTTHLFFLLSLSSLHFSVSHSCTQKNMFIAEKTNLGKHIYILCWFLHRYVVQNQSLGRSGWTC